ANIGAGNITANYDGLQKHRTKVGADARTGSNTVLVAPVEVGDGAYTGAGAVVTRDVPPGALAKGVPATIEEGWVAKRGADASVGASHHRGVPLLRLRAAAPQARGTRADLGATRRRPPHAGRRRPPRQRRPPHRADPGLLRRPGRPPHRGATAGRPPGQAGRGR